MSKYTTEVRFICETYSGLLESTGYANVEEVIAGARSKVFDFTYPIFDEEYKSVLETKILKHFYTREIGAETVGLWKLWLNTRMNEIMPYYNKLYKSELLDFNPLYDVDVTRTHAGTTTGTKEDSGETKGTTKEQRDRTGKTTGNTTETRKTSGTGKSESSGKSTDNTTTERNEKNRYSDTPQGSIQNVENDTYLTNARVIDESGSNNSSVNSSSDNTNEYSEDASVSTENTIDVTDGIESSGETSGTSKNSSVINNTEDYLDKVQGKQSGSSYAKLLEDYRATFLNIDMQVINELNDLFMNLW